MVRRHFLMSAAGAAGVFESGSFAAGPNDRIRVAIVGLRGQARNHIRSYGAMNDVEIAAMCDVDETVLNERLSDVEKLGRKRPQRFIDFRKVLESKDIDAVSIATPNFHHTLQAVWACQAGKDVYVEKPCSHNIFEARQIVAAARKYDRIVQHGTNGRSTVSTRAAMQHLRDGVIGDVFMARGLCFKMRDTIGRAPVEPVPSGVHYDLWTGPAKVHPFTRNRFHYNWHWFWEYGNGDIGNQGPHQLDVARWGLGVKYPVKVNSTGGHFLFDDDQETPNTQVATFEFDDNGRKKLLVFEVRHWMSNDEKDVSIGNLFYGSKGYLTIKAGVPNSGFQTYLGKEGTPGPSGTTAEGGSGAFGGNHWRNFIEAVRSRRREDLHAEIEEGAISSTLVHLANISYRLGRTLNFDSAQFKCTGDAEANAMFTREYRKPFVVPDKV